MQDLTKPHTLKIPPKISGTGTIHDIASELCTREITFPAGHRYAIVEASYYTRGANADAASTHATLEEAIEAKFASAYSSAIINRAGKEMDY